MASAIFYYIFLLFLLPFLATAQRNGTIQVDATLTAGDESTSSWLSASRDFAFGFHRLDNNDLYLLSIWYNNIPERTIVWYASKDNDPAVVPGGSQVKLTSDQGLLLNDPQGKEIWNPGVDFGQVSYGVMNDTGNFQLVSNSSGELWESFKHPTDTLLPTQIMETGGILFSRQSETNFSRGRFQFRLLDDGNLVLNIANLPTNFAYDAYYVSGTYNSTSRENSGYQVVFNEAGYMYILRRNGQKSDIAAGKPPASTDYYHRATLNFDGVFTQYFRPKSGNGNWSVVWSKPNNNICLAVNGDIGSGVCGYNSICYMNNDSRPSCRCPRGYSLLDENDTFGSCKPDFDLSCSEGGQGYNQDLYDFFDLGSVNWPMSDYERFTPYNEVQCKNSCLTDCFCSVAIFGGDSCWLKRLPLSNGRQESTGNSKAFVKYRKSDANGNAPDPFVTERSPNPENWKEQKMMNVTGSILLGSSVFINFVLVVAVGVTFYFINKRKLMKTPQGESNMETNLRCFTYKELAEATNNFNEEVGRGAFGVVYKGVIETIARTTIVAVKKLDRVLQDGEKEFKNEVMVIGQTHHKNLVKLLGFCDEGQNRLLVYEFVSNGTLASLLFGNSSSKPSWNLRIQIAFGIVKGMLYLHEECSTQIIHCDIKPQNILLDEHYNPRISDFGLAKLLTLNQSHTKTIIRGTKGYVAPEWFRNSAITPKVDVYSFGVLLLEIICCRKSVDVEMGEENAILTDWAFDCYKNKRLDNLVNDDMEALSDIKELEKFVKIAIWCIQEDPSLRPTLRKVSQMLEGVVDVNVPPNPSPFGNSMN
ncbi:Receptor-like protein kinase [Melia azedarach]|uniref:Receptor-like protein kinase n=1 Tax=Melia azedarach TaxID=155640 RepID=A0ACC1YM73_MELAZ|nr:Receptor-like protein kinase [Melia azedarach]